MIGIIVAAVLLLVAVNNMGVWGYLLHNPGVWNPWLMLRTLLLPAGGVAMSAVLAWGLGRRLIRVLRVAAGPDELLLAFGLGAGLLAWGVLILGLIGRLSTPGFAVLGLLALAAAVPELRRTAAARLSLPRFTLETGPALLCAVLAFAAFHVFILASAPPTDWDVLAYHLALPKLYLRAHGLCAVPWLLHAHWPHLMEVFYSVPLSIGCDQAAALWHAALCAVLVRALYSAARRELGAACAWTGAALLAGQPALLLVATQAHNDGALALFHFLACLAVWEWSRTRWGRVLAVAGLLSGLAAACKLQGLILAAALAVWVCLRPASARERLRAVLIYLGCVMAVCAPWFIRSYAQTGNPVWPFAAELFGGLGNPAEAAAVCARSNLWRWPPDWTLLSRYGPQFLLLPAAFTAIAAGRPGLALPPFLRFLWVPAVPLLVLMAPYHEAWRFFLPGMPAVALSAAWWAVRAGGRPGWRRLAAAAAVAFGVFPVLRSSQNNQLFPVLGLRSLARPGVAPREVYLERSLDHYRFYKDADARLGSGAKVLLFREIRGYYLDADYQWGDPINQTLIAYRKIADVASLAARLKELGVTHVLVNEGVGIYGPNEDYYDRRTLALMGMTLSRCGRPVLREGALALYELR